MVNLLTIRLQKTFKTYSLFLKKNILLLGTLILSFSMELFSPIKAVPTGNSSNISFSGNSKNPNKSGGEYIVFRLTNNTGKGLVYVQDSDVFSCFSGSYNGNAFHQVTFAYPDMETGKWIKTKSNELISLSDFPHKLNYSQISPGANNIFQECLRIL